MTGVTKMKTVLSELSADDFELFKGAVEKEAERRDDPYKRVSTMNSYEFEQFRAELMHGK